MLRDAVLVCLLTLHAEPRRTQTRSTPAAGRLDLVNRCRPLAANARHLQIMQGPMPSLAATKSAEGEVLLRINSELMVATTLETALDSRCQRIVSELGPVSDIVLPKRKVGARSATHNAPAVLQKAYGNPSIERHASAQSGEDPVLRFTDNSTGAPHRSDVFLLHRSVQQRVGSSLSKAFGMVRRIPLLKSCWHAGVRGGASVILSQLVFDGRPTLTMRLLRYLPWRCQRFAANLMIKSILCVDGYERYGSCASTKRHPLQAVHTVPVLSHQECDDAVREADSYASQFGWTTGRHLSYATTDIPVSRLPKTMRLWEERVFPAIASTFRSKLDLPDDSTIEPLDIFVVKYDVDVQRELSVHRDNGLLTFSLLLSEPSDFVGGGTYFEEDGAVYRSTRGVAVLHSALVRHGGYPIVNGTRYVLVGFCKLSSSRLAADYPSWRFGNPPWFLSSRSVSDAQILSRVWPTSDNY